MSRTQCKIWREQCSPAACMTLQAVGSISTWLLYVNQVASGRKKLKVKNPETDFEKGFSPHFKAQNVASV